MANATDSPSVKPPEKQEAQKPDVAPQKPLSDEWLKDGKANAASWAPTPESYPTSLAFNTSNLYGAGQTERQPYTAQSSFGQLIAARYEQRELTPIQRDQIARHADREAQTNPNLSGPQLEQELQTWDRKVAAMETKSHFDGAIRGVNSKRDHDVSQSETYSTLNPEQKHFVDGIGEQFPISVFSRGQQNEAMRRAVDYVQTGGDLSEGAAQKFGTQIKDSVTSFDRQESIVEQMKSAADELDSTSNSADGMQYLLKVGSKTSNAIAVANGAIEEGRGVAAPVEQGLLKAAQEGGQAVESFFPATRVIEPTVTQFADTIEGPIIRLAGSAAPYVRPLAPVVRGLEPAASFAAKGLPIVGAAATYGSAAFNVGAGAYQWYDGDARAGQLQMGKGTAMLGAAVAGTLLCGGEVNGIGALCGVAASSYTEHAWDTVQQKGVPGVGRLWGEAAGVMIGMNSPLGSYYGYNPLALSRAGGDFGEQAFSYVSSQVVQRTTRIDNGGSGW